MASQEDANADLFIKIEAQIQSGQRKKALRTLEEVLKVSPKDEDAIKAKIYVLIDLDRYQEALSLINQSPAGHGIEFQKAYCLYRLGQLSQGLEVLEASPTKNSIASLQLRAQIHHRLGDFDSAIRDYEEIAAQHGDLGTNSKTNLLAAYIQGHRSKEVQSAIKSMKITPNDGFEVAFNIACSQLEEGHPDSAKVTLQLALRLGRETLLEDDFKEDQVEEELVPLRLQMAFADAALRNHAQAQQQFEEISGADLGEEASQAVALNNKIAEKLITADASNTRSIAQESLKLMDSLFEKGAAGLQLKSALEARLSLSQHQALYANRVSLLILAGRHQSARDIVQRLLKRYQESSSIQLQRVSLAALGGRLKEAQQLLSQNQNQNQETKLIGAQLACQAQDYEQACNILAGLDDHSLRGEAAFITTRSGLLEACGREQEALSLLKDAQSGLASSSGSTKGQQKAVKTSLLPVLARLQLKAGQVKAAFTTFKELQKLDRNSAGSAQVIRQLASAALENDPEAATSLEDYLDPLPKMPSEDLKNLEATGAGRMSKNETSKRAANPDGSIEPAKRKRKRQRRLPKAFDPENPGPLPDPERWLPKWQRAEFRRKRRSRKDKDSKKGHQGGAVDESLDRTNTETPAAQPNLPKRGQRSRGKSGRK